ncbi:MAG: acyl-CoA thioesterase [Butyrivibrio sp.]|nr:acyl-CoA thioesterase [Butyrivibrio sp.]
MMYRHKVQYYETDKMGITHHSNYIRWMEEARIAFLAEKGWSYARLEDEGIISPVVSVDAHYKKTTTFNDDVAIDVCVIDFTGVKLKLGYKMYLEDKLVFEGESMHCFLNKEGRPIRLKSEYPEFYEMLDLEKENK